VELFVFGGAKGVGESILAKLDDSTYGIIDSFIDRKTGNPRVLDYLNKKSIPLTSIKFIVLTHCHHDHFTGLAKLVELCTNATFYVSKAIGIKSFHVLISAYSRKVTSKHNYFKEILDTFAELKKTNRKAKMLTDVSKPILTHNGIRIQSFSPNVDTEKFLTPLYKRETAKFLKGSGIKLLTNGYNYQSVVISIESDSYKILLGADQEFHRTISTIGWEAISNLNHFKTNKFDLFKVPHHGSDTGFDSTFWSRILKKESILSLTPYSRSGLPNAKMINTVKSFGASYLTSNPSAKVYKKLPGRIGKKTKHLEIKRLATRKAGIIHNKYFTGKGFSVNLVPDAVQL